MENTDIKIKDAIISKLYVEGLRTKNWDTYKAEAILLRCVGSIKLIHYLHKWLKPIREGLADVESHYKQKQK